MLECLQVMQNQMIISNTVSERLSGGMGCVLGHKKSLEG